MSLLKCSLPYVVSKFLVTRALASLFLFYLNVTVRFMVRVQTLAGHVPIELLRLLKNLLDANADNKLFAKVNGKRKKEVGLVVLAKFSAFTAELRIAEVLEREIK